jgi:hypothetical protein
MTKGHGLLSEFQDDNERRNETLTERVGVTILSTMFETYALMANLFEKTGDMFKKVIKKK